MKIFYLSSSTIPSRTANSVHVMKMCNAFINNGHEVTLFSKKGETASSNMYEFYGVREKFKVVRINANSIRGIGSALYSNQVRKYVEKIGNPDIFFGRDLWALIFLTNKNIPIFYESHALPVSKTRVIAEKKLFLNKNFKRLIVISQALKDEYLNIFPFLNNVDIIVAHDGADIPKNLINREHKKESRKTVAGYVGHLYSGRGIELIVELAKKFTEIEFQIIGGTEEDLCRWKNVTAEMKNLVFLGFVPNGELYKKYEKFDFLLAPYQKKVAVSGGKGDTSRWMSPLKIFEYMSFGKPMIVSEIPVLKEVLKSGQNCLLCKPEDINEWIAAINKFNNDKTFAELLGQNALDDFKDNYTWDIRAKKVLNNI